MRTGIRALGEIACFDETCDVLVVGLGCAGASAAIEAREAGDLAECANPGSHPSVSSR